MDIYDIHAMAATWLLGRGDASFNQGADLNRDNRIDNRDSDILSANFNTVGTGVVTIYYYHFDGSGNVIALSDSSGNSVETYAYDVFGRVDTAGGVGNPYFFTGRRFDTETGLYYYRARYYDPTIGRFIQTDPIGYGDGMNLYIYCGNNPLRWLDPMGLCQQTSQDLLNQLGSYGNPYQDQQISSSFRTAEYNREQTTQYNAWGLGYGALRDDYGSLNAITTGSGFEGSLRVTTYRYPGEEISYHELERIEAIGETYLVGGAEDVYGWQYIQNADRGDEILLGNPVLMERAIEQNETSAFGRFMEGLIESIFSANKNR